MDNKLAKHISIYTKAETQLITYIIAENAITVILFEGSRGIR